MEADIIVTCPYNPAHRIRKFKLSDHMVKCKKSCAKPVNKTTCPLNSTHIIDADRLREHLACCDSLGKLVEDVDGVHQQEAESSHVTFVDSYMPTEDWNQDPAVPSYDPMLHSAEKKVMRSISGLSKSERKLFRESERMRIANLKEVGTAKPFLPISEDEKSLFVPRNISGVFSNEGNGRHNNTAEVSDFATKIHDKSAELDEFQKTLYDELVHECSDTSMKLNHSLYKSDVDVSIKNNSQHVVDESRSTFDQFIAEEILKAYVQDQKTEAKTVEVDANDMFRLDNKLKENRPVENASSIETAVSHGQDTNNLASLLNDITKLELATGTKKIDKETDENLKWEEVFGTFNERLAYLTDIQNTAAEESARLLKQLKDLKLYQETVPKK